MKTWPWSAWKWEFEIEFYRQEGRQNSWPWPASKRTGWLFTQCSKNSPRGYFYYLLCLKSSGGSSHHTMRLARVVFHRLKIESKHRIFEILKINSKFKNRRMISTQSKHPTPSPHRPSTSANDSGWIEWIITFGYEMQIILTSFDEWLLISSVWFVKITKSHIFPAFQKRGSFVNG
jgi:hypothetical protein